LLASLTLDVLCATNICLHYSCSILEILQLMMSMVEDWSSTISEWWGGMFWSFMTVQSSNSIKYKFTSSTYLSFMIQFAFTNMIGFASCSISPNIREGLLETFYGVYEKDPDRVDAFNRFYVKILWILYYNFPFLNSQIPWTGKCLQFGACVLVLGSSINDSNGCSCSYRRYDCC